MLAGGSRLSHHLRECDPRLGLGLGFYSARVVQLSCACPPNPSSTPILAATHHHYHYHYHHRRRLQRTASSSYSIHSKSPGDFPAFSDCFSQREEDHELPSEGLSPVAGGIVALGKFDALHVGHRELAIKAAKVGRPFLLSFVGMAEVLGWEPRAPIVAKCDRKRVLSSWAPYCSDMAPAEFQIEFSSVRHLTPRQFVEKLSIELGVGGVVAGENYRFGYRAAGDALELARLCEEYGIEACIIKSVMDKNEYARNINASDSKERGQVSSTRVRRALAVGDMRYVSELLGRKHRLILMANNEEGLSSNGSRVSVPKSCLLNLAPKEGLYGKCSIVVGEEKVVACKVVIDITHVHIEMDEVDTCNIVGNQALRLFRIEFGD
ncbi:FAD synthetase 2, chloroplastic-like [Alnus glutinosa]|uniref:FAD synthetase 2, chloroplastic-like n=1 Tax=Alnus glutinosa TaxID=3517 RepID=UPI002D79CDE0|nr:FAD synthetase 2, chloroplastic-like [Alnus glutinosa]